MKNRESKRLTTEELQKRIKDNMNYIIFCIILIVVNLMMTEGKGPLAVWSSYIPGFPAILEFGFTFFMLLSPYFLVPVFFVFILKDLGKQSTYRAQNKKELEE